MKKRFLLTLLVITMSIIVFGTISASAATEGIYTYTVSNGEATITYCNRSASGEIVIPDTLGGCSVTSIGSSAFSDCSSLISVTIPDSVTSIGSHAFSDCSSLASVTIPGSVTSIGSYAFSDCSNLVSVTIPDSVTSISSGAFEGCASLISVTIPDSVTSIGDSAFYDCRSLKKVKITDLKAWCNVSFGNSDSNPLSNGGKLYLNGNLVTDITIPDDVTSIGSWAFSGCDSLVSVTIPDSVTSIGDYAFYNCDSLISVTIPDSVTSIGDSAFCDCDSLVSVTIPDSVTSIGSYAFCNCSSLESVTILDGVTSIGDSAFSACSSLISVTIPDSVTSIGSYAFRECYSLASVTIPGSVTSIGSWAFSGCTSLVSVTILDGVTSIGDHAFLRCESLVSVTFPDSVTSIGDSAFYRNGNLKYVALPVEIKYIRNDAFNYCDSITTVFYAGSETNWENIAFYSWNENLTNAKIVYNATKKTYKFDTNCDAKIDDITGYAIFTMPTVKNGEMTLFGWYDNASLSGEPVDFPYYGEATTLYAAWTDRTGKTFDDAFIAKTNQEYTVTTTESEQLVYFEFVPNLSKEYRFYTTGSKDTYGYLYNSNKSQIASNNDDWDGNNFCISYNLTAGETYYIAAKIYSGTGTFTFVVEELVDYRINEITIKDMAGNSLQAIPTGTFLATVSFTNVSSSSDTVIILAQYTDSGAFKGSMYVQTEDVPVGSTIKLSIPVDNSKGDVAKLKAFCWESFGSLTPIGNPVSFPVE